MEISQQYFVFNLDKQTYALKLSSVEKVIRIVELIPVPETIQYLLGLINVEGRILPVFNIRERFRLPKRDMDLEDRILLTSTSYGVIGIIVDSVYGIMTFNQNDIRIGSEIYPNMDNFIEGVWKSGDKSTLIYNVDHLFPPLKKGELDKVLSTPQPIDNKEQSNES